MGFAVTSTEPLPSPLGSADARVFCTTGAVLKGAPGWRKSTSALGTTSQKSFSISLPAQQMGHVEANDSALQMLTPEVPSVGEKGWHRSGADGSTEALGAFVADIGCGSSGDLLSIAPR